MERGRGPSSCSLYNLEWFEYMVGKLLELGRLSRVINLTRLRKPAILTGRPLDRPEMQPFDYMSLCHNTCDIPGGLSNLLSVGSFADPESGRGRALDMYGMLRSLQGPGGGDPDW